MHTRKLEEGEGSKDKENILPPETPLIDNRLKNKVKEGQCRYWNERRKIKRMREKGDEQKREVKRLKDDNYQLRVELTRTEKELAETANSSIGVIHAQQQRLALQAAEHTRVIKSQAALAKRCKRFAGIKSEAEKRGYARALKRGKSFHLRHKGVYTSEARSIARQLVASGTAEKHVGTAIQEIGKLMGVEVKEKMSRRTAGRTVLEQGVAADIQLGYDMVMTDSTFVLVIQ